MDSNAGLTGGGVRSRRAGRLRILAPVAVLGLVMGAVIPLAAADDTADFIWALVFLSPRPGSSPPHPHRRPQPRDNAYLTLDPVIGPVGTHVRVKGRCDTNALWVKLSFETPYTDPDPAQGNNAPVAGDVGTGAVKITGGGTANAANQLGSVRGLSENIFDANLVIPASVSYAPVLAGLKFVRATCLADLTAPFLTLGMSTVYCVPTCNADGSPAYQQWLREQLTGTSESYGTAFQAIIAQFPNTPRPQSSDTTTTSTTTTRPSGGAPGGGGGGVPASDTTPPTVGGISFSANDVCHSEVVSAQASDDVGVQSVTLQWSYAGASHSTTMSGAGSYSANLGALGGNGGTLSVTVVARDAGGNAGSASASTPIALC